MKESENSNEPTGVEYTSPIYFWTHLLIVSVWAGLTSSSRTSIYTSALLFPLFGVVTYYFIKTERRTKVDQFVAAAGYAFIGCWVIVNLLDLFTQYPHFL